MFTLLHEYGHLITRTNSACLEGPRRTKAQSDTVERWCEEFSGAAILPRELVQQSLALHGWPRQIESVDAVRAIAREFRASLRATTLRLIDLGVADWRLYAALPPTADRKPGGGGGAGRDRAQIRSEQYGDRAIGVFAEALRSGVVSRGDVLDYLTVSPEALGMEGGAEAASVGSG
jgi:Zn-dependent peptidase ImmA (M78 family)